MIDLGRTAMSAEEIDVYLRADGRFVALASVRRDGRPLVIPMGYYYDGAALYFSTAERCGLARRLRRDTRASVAVFDHEPIHGCVLVNGMAEEVADPDDTLSLRMHHRYPKPGLENSPEHDRIWLSVPRVVFRLSTADAFGMDQRKAADDVCALAMPDAPPATMEPPANNEAAACPAGCR